MSATFSNAASAKEYASEFLHAKVWGQSTPVAESFTDYDPGVDGPTDPSPPPDDPTENDVEYYIKARNARTMWEIKNSWVKGNS